MGDERRVFVGFIAAVLEWRIVEALHPASSRVRLDFERIRTMRHLLLKAVGAVALGAMTMAGVPAQAQWHGHRGWGGHSFRGGGHWGGHRGGWGWRSDDDDAGWALGAGILGLGLGAAIASDNDYYDGYYGYPYGYS